MACAGTLCSIYRSASPRNKRGLREVMIKTIKLAAIQEHRKTKVLFEVMSEKLRMIKYTNRSSITFLVTKIIKVLLFKIPRKLFADWRNFLLLALVKTSLNADREFLRITGN